MTERQRQWLIWGALAVMIAVAGFMGIVFPIPVPPIPTSVTSQGFIYPPGAIYIEAGGKNQTFSSGTLQTFKSGSTLTADAGSTVSLLGTNVFAVPSFSGNTTINGNAAVTGTLLVTGTSTLVGATTATGVISANGGISGTLNTAAQPNVTSLGTLPAATITNLTTTNVTGTLATAAQPNVTSLGTLPLATITNLTTTNVTGTLATAAQPSITSLGTLPVATITNLSSTNITATNDLISLNFKPSANGSAVAVNYCMSSDCDTGLWYPGDNIIGISTGGVERARVTNAGLSGDNATFTTLTVTNLISQSVGFSATATSTLVDVTARNITTTGAITTSTTLGSVGAATVGSLTTAGDVAARNITATGTIAADSVTFTGPIKYGYVASQVDGADITHGFSTTPTVCIVSATSGYTASVGVITTTLFTANVGATTPVYWMCGK